jgi:hypothetical protein
MKKFLVYVVLCISLYYGFAMLIDMGTKVGVKYIYHELAQAERMLMNPNRR